MSAARVQGLAVTPGVAHSLHLTEIDLPDLGLVDARVRVLNAGICGTDREIIETKLGTAPTGSTNLVIGHEVLGRIEAVGDDVSNFKPGDLVTSTVRRGCGCPPCAAGASDFCVALRYTERGIIGLHGFMTVHFTEASQHLISVPESLRPIGVLIEPTSVAEKAWRVAVGVQARITGWEPATAVVFGAGPIGMLQALVLRDRGLDVTVIARTPESESLAAALLGEAGIRYLSTREQDLSRLKSDLPNVDVIIECSGSSEAVTFAMGLLGNNGVLVLLSITGGPAERPLPLDRLNFEFVLGNKTMVGSVNSSAADFRAAIIDLTAFERRWPGLTGKLITHRLNSLDEAVGLMESTRGAIKAIIELEGRR